jgi:hypothetical protein
MLALPRQRAIAIVVFLFSAGVSAARASTIIDLGSGGSGTANGAIYEWTDFGPTGTGTVDAFLRIQGNGIERGYNHSLGFSAPWDTKPGLWTHDIQYEDLVVRNVLGVDYYEFLLDINEAANDENRLLSLNNVQIFTRDGAISSGPNEDFSDLGTQRFNSDTGADGDTTVNLDYTLNDGSGTGDMFLLVPVANFAGTLPGDFVYFFSEFGNPNESDAGFEEWSMRQQLAAGGGEGGGGVPDNTAPVPEPGSMMLLGTGLLFAARKLRG